jgi:tetratricopeptide (TPR) repeat protein
MGRYKESAAAVYAVLAVGPGWDWTTLSSFYPNTDIYTAQLRALERYHRQNPGMGDADFLLGYHYLTCGYLDEAIARFKAAVRLNPQDRLSAQLLASLTPSDAAAPAGDAAVPAAPAAPATPAAPVTAAGLAGSWTATRPGSAPIQLALRPDNTYTWDYSQENKPQSFQGSYSVADNLLILKQGTSPVMVGQVTPLGDGSFNFKLAGGSSSDPGLTFTR